MRRLRQLACGPALAFLLASAPAFAEEAEYIAKFTEGRALIKKEKWAEALEKFQASAALKPASGTYLNIGDCQEHLGRFASALSSFEQARALAAEEKKPDREKEAAERAKVLGPMLSSITVKAPAGVHIAIDGGPAEADKPVQVDGGPHLVRIEADCKKPKDIAVTVANKTDAQTVAVDLATLDADPKCAKSSTAPTTSATPSTERILSYVAGGVGVVALGFGVGFGISAAGKKGDLEDACPTYPSGCNPAQRAGLDSTYDSASTSATISTVGFIGAVAFIAGGVALYVLSPEWKRDASKTGFVPGRFVF